MIRKKKEGKPLPETQDMKIWREEFDQMSIEEHDRILKNLGLDDEDIDDFNETVTHHKSAEDLLGIDKNEQEPEEKPVKKKKE
ncbi:MAG: hypothetical protein NUV57_00390 [archaeon]|nr:hypothetical protein [archaeon]